MIETPNLDELLSPENFPPGDPLRGDAERELASLRSAIERLRAKADLCDWAESIIKLNWDPTLSGDLSKMPKEIADWLTRYRAAATAEGERHHASE